MSEWLDILFIAYFLALNAAYALLIGLATLDIIQRRATKMPEFDRALLSEASTPPITLIAPAYNEQMHIVASVRSLQQLKYTHLEFVVVNDGSTDDTLARLTEAFDLELVDMVFRRDMPTAEVRGIYVSRSDPRLLVVDKVNGGKADALNVGLNVCRTPLVCCLDADTVLDSKAMLRMVEPYLFDERHVVAVGGTVRVANGCQIRNGHLEKVELPRSWLARFQIVEYLRSFLFGRMGFNRLGGNLIISGAFGLFLREAVVAVGGYRPDTVGEDMELVTRIHEHLRATGRPYRVVQIPDPVAYTEAPEDLTTLANQRDRWQRGLAHSLWLHKRVLFNPWYGVVGMVVSPIFAIFELLGPVVELAGYLWFVASLLMGRMDLAVALLYLTVAVLLGTALSIQSLVMDDLESGSFKLKSQRAVLAVVALLENVGFRQFTLLFRLRGMLRFLFGVKTWGKMVRQGLERPKS